MTRVLMVGLMLCLAALPIRANEAEDIVPVTATGESEVSYDAATEKALREAVRQTCGVALSSQTNVADFALIRDTIYTRAQGYVRKYQVLEQKRGRGAAYMVTVAADVARGRISDDFLAIKNWIEYAGRPQFAVTVDEKAGSSRGVGAWVEGAMNDYLEKTGFTALCVKAFDESLQRQYMQAAEAGDSARARQLMSQMGAPYGVHIVALGKSQTQDIYGVSMNVSSVELQVTVVYRDSGELLASKSASGKATTGDATGIQDAVQRAMDEVFPQVLDRILSHWAEDIDRGIAVTVQLSGASYEVASDLARKIKQLKDVRSADVVEAPDGGIAVIRVIGMLKATDIADRIPAWTNGQYRAGLQGQRLVTARPAQTPLP